MTRDEVLVRLRALEQGRDTETVHAEADALLVAWIAVTDPELAAAYEAVPKWYA